MLRHSEADNHRPWQSCSVDADQTNRIRASQFAWARDATKVAGYICGIVVLDYSAEPWHYAFHRLIETTLGVLVAWAISYVPKLIRMEEPPGS